MSAADRTCGLVKGTVNARTIMVQWLRNPADRSVFLSLRARFSAPGAIFPSVRVVFRSILSDYHPIRTTLPQAAGGSSPGVRHHTTGTCGFRSGAGPQPSVK